MVVKCGGKNGKTIIKRKQIKNSATFILSLLRHTFTDGINGDYMFRIWIIFVQITLGFQVSWLELICKAILSFLSYKKNVIEKLLKHSENNDGQLGLRLVKSLRNFDSYSATDERNLTKASMERCLPNLCFWADRKRNRLPCFLADAFSTLFPWNNWTEFTKTWLEPNI